MRRLVEHVVSDRIYDGVLTKDVKPMKPGGSVSTEIPAPHLVPSNGGEGELQVLAQIICGIGEEDRITGLEKRRQHIGVQERRRHAESAGRDRFARSRIAASKSSISASLRPA